MRSQAVHIRSGPPAGTSQAPPLRRLLDSSARVGLAGAARLHSSGVSLDGSIPAHPSSALAAASADPNRPWDPLAGWIARRYARSFWRLGLDAGLLLLLLVPLYLLRGPRLVLLAVAAVVGVAGAATAFARPRTTLAVLVFILFSGIDALVPGPLTYGLLAVIAARLAFDALDGQGVDWGAPLHRLALAVLLAACVTSLLAVWDFTTTLTAARQIAIGGLLFAAISRYTTTCAGVRRIVLVATLGLALAALLPLKALGSLGGLGMAAFGEARFMTLGSGDPNVSAAQINCALPGAFYLAAWLPRRWRWPVWLVIVLLIAGVILSSSRAGMAVMGLVVPACLLFERRLHRHAMWIVLALIATLLVLPAPYWVRFVSIGQFGGIIVDRSLQLRQHSLAASWDMFVHHPWIGVGLGNVQSNMPRYMMLRLMAHNTWIEIAASLGAVGIVAYATWWFTGVRMAWQARARSRHNRQDEAAALAFATAASLLAFGIVGMTLSIPFYPMLWLPLALATVLRRLSA